jgi:hypothetical protein
VDWKVKLNADDSSLAQLQAKHTDPSAKVTRDGIDWYLESSEFELLSDPTAVREKATAIVQSVLASAVGLGNVYRMHYDGSKTVYPAESS